MRISGLQKLTLLDFPGKVACTVFTGGCNFRCPFCHNASLVLRPNENPEIEFHELMDFLKKRQGMLDGVCITGGEPLMHPDTPELIKAIKELGYLVKLDTNGSYPDALKQIVSSGLVDHVAVDIKNSKESYAKTVGIENYDISGVCESVSFLMEDPVSYTFRTTMAHPLHTEEDMHKIGRWIKGCRRYVLQNFVDSGDLVGEGISALTEQESKSMLEIARLYIPNAEMH